MRFVQVYDCLCPTKRWWPRSVTARDTFDATLVDPLVRSQRRRNREHPRASHRTHFPPAAGDARRRPMGAHMPAPRARHPRPLRGRRGPPPSLIVPRGSVERHARAVDRPDFRESDGRRALAPQDGHHDWIKSEAGRLDRLLSSLKNAPQESSVEGDGQSAGLGSPPPVAIVTASVSPD